MELEGNIFTDVDSAHYNAHVSLEDFWDKYRGSGRRPTINEYNEALKKSLKDAGLSENQANKAVSKAAGQQISSGLHGGDFVPKVPRRINLP